MKETREAALDAFLRLIGERGYDAVSLRDVAQAAGLGFAEFYALFPGKAALVGAFMVRIDVQVLEGVPSSSDLEETARDRLFDTMMRRYDALQPYRPVLRSLRQAATHDPLLALVLAPGLRRSMACMLEAASLSADGLSGALRQNGLLAIDFIVSGVFDRDESPDLSKTMAALDRRLKSAEKWVQVFESHEKTIQPAERINVSDSHAM